MKLGFVGLGRMGYNIVLNLLDNGHMVVANNRSKEPVDKIKKEGALAAYTLESLIEQLETPRIVWIMLPAGKPVNTIIERISGLLDKGDILINGGNSFYKDAIKSADFLSAKGLHFLDVGTSGGIDGARCGACMMIGGEEDIFRKIEPIFKDMCVPNGYGYVGGHGAGHFVKMVHNGVEYGMMQSIGEGFELLEKSEFALNLEEVAGIWANGSVIRSWLIDLAQEAFQKDSNLQAFMGPVEDSGEGRWTVEAGLDYQVPLPAISTAIWERYRSRSNDRLADRVISALREGFGHHISGNK